MFPLELSFPGLCLLLIRGSASASSRIPHPSTVSRGCCLLLLCLTPTSSCSSPRNRHNLRQPGPAPPQQAFQWHSVCLCDWLPEPVGSLSRFLWGMSSHSFSLELCSYLCVPAGIALDGTGDAQTGLVADPQLGWGCPEQALSWPSVKPVMPRAGWLLASVGRASRDWLKDRPGTGF